MPCGCKGFPQCFDNFFFMHSPGTFHKNGIPVRNIGQKPVDSLTVCVKAADGNSRAGINNRFGKRLHLLSDGDDDLKLFSAIVVAVFLAIPYLKSTRKGKER